MSIEIKSDILAKELNQGIVPLGVPKAYQYDAALVEAARAAVNQGIDDVAEAGATAKAAVEAQEQASKSDVNALGDKILAQMKHGYGYPFTAATAAAMTDTAKIYVYTGSETGYTNGNWYYYNGTAWTSGGVYNATALESDKTLSVSGGAADAGAVGDNLKLDANSELNISTAYSQAAYGFFPSNSTTFVSASNYYTLTYNVGNIKKVRVNIDSAGNANSYAYFRALDSNGTILSQVLNPGNDVVINNTITLPDDTATFTVTGRPDIKTTGTNVYKVGLILSERNQAQIDDAKKGYNGELYNSLGDSVRGQSAQLFGYLEDDRINLDGTNYFTNTGTEAMYSSVETGYYRVDETEIVSAATSFKTYHYIAKPYEKITFSVLENGPANLYDVYRAYDADGNLLEHVANNGTTSGTVTFTKEISRDMAEIWITSQAIVAPIVSHYYTIADAVNGALSSGNFASGEKIVSEE